MIVVKKQLQDTELPSGVSQIIMLEGKRDQKPFSQNDFSLTEVIAHLR